MDWSRVFERIAYLVMHTPALDYLLCDLPPECLAEQRFCGPGASDGEIQEAEARLGVHLPPSYREFLRESNGLVCFPGLGRLSAAAEIGWFRDLSGEWCEILDEDAENWSTIPRSTEYPNDDWPAPYVRNLLQVSEGGEGDVVLLNPQVVSSDGEWEAFSLYSHGSSCYRSFGDLMVTRLRVEEEYYKSNPDDPLAHLQPLLDLTRQALAGHTAEVKPEIERRYQEGERAAALPLAEIAAFEWNWSCCSKYAIEAMLDEPQAVRDLHLPCLWALCANRLGDWSDAEAVLDLLPSPSPETAECYHQRIAIVRQMIQRRVWTGLPFGIDRPMPGSEESDRDERRRAFERCCARDEREHPRNWSTPERADSARWTLAMSYRLPDVAMEIADRRPAARFADQNFEIARCYAGAGCFDDAWRAILHALRYWQGPNGGAWTRVAPVELLIDRAFERVMTLERCLRVLATGRPPLCAESPLPE